MVGSKCIQCNISRRECLQKLMKVNLRYSTIFCSREAYLMVYLMFLSFLENGLKQDPYIFPKSLSVCLSFTALKR